MQVYILGGLGTKFKHVLKIANIYKTHNIKPTFIENKHLNYCRRHIYEKNAFNLAEQILETKQPYLIHSISEYKLIRKKVKEN